MSAFKCNDKHMQYIANGLFTLSNMEEKDEENTIDKVNRYIDMNIQALDCRYEDGKMLYQGYKYINKINVDIDLNKFQLLKALSCLRYQCSEGEVIDSPTYKELNEDIEDLMYEIISKMPEYEKAQWEII